MYPNPTIHTSLAELDGTLSGIIVMIIVMFLALAVLIGLVYWANAHPEVAGTGRPRMPDQPPGGITTGRAHTVIGGESVPAPGPDEHELGQASQPR